MAVDDTAAFRAVFHNRVYRTFEQFESDLKRFQLRTASCFFKSDVLTSVAYRRKTGKELPEGVRYKSVQYRCVHCCRRGYTCKRYKSYDCKAHITVRHNGWCYDIVSYSVEHSHNFHVGKPFLYVNNRRLPQHAEEDIYRMMQSFKDTRELRRYALKHYGKRLNRYDLRTIRDKMKGKVEGNSVEDVIHLLESVGQCNVEYEESEVRYIFFVPRYVRDLVELYSEVLLADATHQMNCGGYILWHCMLVDVHGIGRSVFYALLPNETTASYLNAVRNMRLMLPATETARTVVIDKCMAQVHAFKTVYPSTRLVLCRFHLLKDVTRRCNGLSGKSATDRLLIKQCVRNLVYARSSRLFVRYLTAIKNRNADAHRYLVRTWLPFVKSWAAHRLTSTCLFGCFTTNRVENENRHLKSGLSERTSLLGLFTAVVNRVLDAHAQWEDLMGKTDLSEHVVDSCFQSLGQAALQFSGYARTRLRCHYTREKVTVTELSDDRCQVQGTRRLYTVLMRDEVTCQCTFSRQWLLPCAHIVHALHAAGRPVEDTLRNNRWVVSHARHLRVTASTSSAIVPLPSTSTVEPVSREQKLRECSQVLGDIQVQVCSLGDTKYREVMDKLREFLRNLSSSHEEVAVSSTSNVIESGAEGTSEGTSEGTRRKQRLLPIPESSGSQEHERKALRFRDLHTKTSKVYRPPRKRRSHAPIPANYDNDKCASCLQSDCEAQSGQVVDWVMCCDCRLWYHQVCVSYAGQEHFTCHRCM